MYRELIGLMVSSGRQWWKEFSFVFFFSDSLELLLTPGRTELTRRLRNWHTIQTLGYTFDFALLIFLSFSKVTEEGWFYWKVGKLVKPEGVVLKWNEKYALIWKDQTIMNGICVIWWWFFLFLCLFIDSNWLKLYKL